MSTAVEMRRHALGWPEGSIRALLAVMVVGLFCALLLIPPKDPAKPSIPAYLIYLVFLILGHYFAARGSRRGQDGAWHRQPLWLPRGCIRLLLLAALVGTVAYRFYTDSEGFQKQWEVSLRSLVNVPELPVVVLGSFFVGALLRMVIGHYPPPWFQDLEAWLSLIAVLLMTVATLIHLVIDPSLSEKLDLPVWEAILSGVVAFYFGERS
jgi:hypothetical protein